MNKKLDLIFEYTLNHRSLTKEDIFDQVMMGSISLVSGIEETLQYPIDIGCFVMNIINLNIARKLNVDVEDAMDSLTFLDDHYGTSYQNINTILRSFDLNIQENDKIIFLHSVYVRPEYRKIGVSKELIKSIYTTQFNGNTFLFTNGEPVQHLMDDYNFAFDEHFLEFNADPDRYMPREYLVGQYFQFDKLPVDDQEINQFKIFGLLNKLGMKRFLETPFFYYEKESDIIKLFKN